MSYIHAINILKEERAVIERHRRNMSRMCDEHGIGWPNGETEAIWLCDLNNAITALESLQKQYLRGDK